MSISQNPRLTLGALAALAFLAAACGSSGSADSAATASAPSASAPLASGKPATSASAGAAVPLPVGPLPPVDLKPGKPGSIGGKEVTAEVCKLDPGVPMMRHDNFDRAIRGAVPGPGGVVYVLDNEGKLRRYTASKAGECDLSIDKSFGEGGVLAVVSDPKEADKFDTLAIDSKGDVYVSGFIAKAQKISGGQASAACTSSGRLYVDPKTGAAFLNTSKVDLAAGCKPAEWKADLGKDAGSAQFLSPVGADVAAIYSVKEKSGNVYKVGLFTDAATKKWTLGDADGDGKMCNVGSVQTCALGVCIVDANCRSLKAADASGKLLGATKIGDMLGLSYPWPRSLSVAHGAAYLAASHAAKDSADKMQYGLVYRIKGL